MSYPPSSSRENRSAHVAHVAELRVPSKRSRSSYGEKIGPRCGYIRHARWACSVYFSFIMRPFFAYGAKKPLHNEARPRERSDRGRFLPIGQKRLFIMRPFLPIRVGKKASSYRGAYKAPLLNLSVRSSVYCVCVSFVVCTGCESCTRSSVARRLKVVAVAGLLWIS